MNQLKEILEAYRNGERGLPTYSELWSLTEDAENHPQFDASKGIYWFSILLKCSALLEVPDDEPTPSGVLKAVAKLVEDRAAAQGA